MDLSPLPFTLRQLQYVVAVAEARSFSRAAAVCHVSQPSLSAQVAEVESSLGVRLFERDRAGVLITPAGEALVDRARQVLVEARDLAQDARRFVDPLAGTLRIGVIPTIAPYLLPDLLAPLREKFPRLTLLWTEEKTDELVSRLGRGELDAALVALEADLGDLEREALFHDPFVVALPKEHPLARGKSALRLEDLAREQVLLLDDGHCFREQVLGLCARERIDEADFRATSLPTLVQMVTAGVGVTLLPKLAVAAEQGRANLALRPLPPPAPGRTVALAWRRRSPFGDSLRQLAATMRKAPRARGQSRM